MNYIVIPFMILGLVILFGAHWIVYYSIIHFFAITDPLQKRILIIILFLLAVSFFAVSFLAHISHNQISRYLYFASGFWLGLLVNLVLACVVSSLIIWTSRFFGFPCNTAIIGFILFLLAAACSIYGVWNAFHPIIRNINVEIKNLPDEWKGKTVVQISDVHLGYIYRDTFINKIVSQINGLHPDIIFITGDLFDGQDGDFLNLVKPLNNLYAPEGIYFVTGNHETYLGVNEAFSILKQTKIQILDDKIIQLDGLQIAGMSYPIMGEKKDTSGFISSQANFIKDMPTILLHHAPTDINKAENLGINLQLSGHTHVGQLFPFNFITHLVYRGYDYGLHKIGDFSIYTTNGTGTWGPPMRTGNRPEIVQITLK
jgi:uncharacterized protein